MKASVQIIASLMVLGLSACDAGTEPKSASRNAEKSSSVALQNSALMKVSVQRVAVDDQSQQMILQGQIKAQQSVRIVPELEGLRVHAVFVEEGALVKAGQILVELSRANIDAELSSARANLARAHAALLSAKSAALQADVRAQRASQEYARYAEVIAVGAVSQEDADSRKANVDAALQESKASAQNVQAQVAEVNALEASLQIALQRSERALIRAPKDGVLSDKRVEVGLVSSLSADPYFILHPNGKREFEAELDLQSLSQLNADSQIQVQAEGKVWAASLRTSSSVVRSADQRASVRFMIPQGDALAVGQAAVAQVTTASMTAIAVPLSAVQFDPAPWVYVLDSQSRAQKRRIVLANNQAQAEMLLVADGLQANERVISKAANLISAGQQVNAIETPTDLALADQSGNDSAKAPAKRTLSERAEL
jgi:HlyD family secretion protein